MEFQDPSNERNEEELPLSPVPIEGSNCGHLTRNLVIVAGIGVGMYLLVGNNVERTAGATRSSKLLWQQQQAEMDRASQRALVDEVRCDASVDRENAN